MPEVWVSRLRSVILSHAAGASGRNFLTGSSSVSLPRSSSRRIAAAVNCLVIDPMRELCGGIVGGAPFEIGESVAFAEENLIAARHEHRSHKVSIGYVGLDETIEVLRRRGEGENEQKQPLHPRSVSRIRSALLASGVKQARNKSGLVRYRDSVRRLRRSPCEAILLPGKEVRGQP